MDNEMNFHNCWHNELFISGTLETKPMIGVFGGKECVSFFLKQRYSHTTEEGKEYERIYTFHFVSYAEKVIEELRNQKLKCVVGVRGGIYPKYKSFRLKATEINISQVYEGVELIDTSKKDE